MALLRRLEFIIYLFIHHGIMAAVLASESVTLEGV
jgi:hypothetical protein